MWAVAGPPRSGTTAMLELIAAWTPLRVIFDFDSERQSRAEHGPGPYYELGSRARALSPDHCVKILHPVTSYRPQRAVVMIRDSESVVASAKRIGMHITAAGVVQRQRDFVERFGDRADIVCLDELNDPEALFARLAASGWPVDGYHPTLELRRAT